MILTALFRSLRTLSSVVEGACLEPLLVLVSTSNDVTKKHDKWQPRSQGLSLPAPKSERRETLVAAGHVPPRIWVVTKNSLKGGAA